MKRYLTSILVVLILASGLAVGCGTKTSPSERDKAVTFYRELYPICNELNQDVNEWNSWLTQASALEYAQNLFSKSKYYGTHLQMLYGEVAALNPPPGLQDLKDKTLAAMSKGIETYAMAQEYALNKQQSYGLKVESLHLEFNKLMSLAADEWDNGLAHYNINPQEIAK